MLFSQTEREWLLGNNKVSKGYERKIKSGKRKKLIILKSLNYHY